MNKETKWLLFSEEIVTTKTKRFNVYNKESKDYLGQIKWYGSFRQYSFFPTNNLVFEKTCLKDISSFLENLMLEREIQKQETYK